MKSSVASTRREVIKVLGLLALQLSVSGCSPLIVAGEKKTALPPHPRLIATREDWQTLAARRRADPDLDRLVELLLQRARSDLKRPPLEHKLVGRRMLNVSREFIRRTLLWTFAYRQTGEAIYLEHARREMLAVAAFPDWNPSHFLDVAEMTAGLALGYDWLYHDLPAAERAMIRQAIVDKGIAQARHGHRTFGLTYNWGQVCIGGMVLGALAVQEDEPELAADLIAAAQRDAFTALGAYQPDGVYPEGPGYWCFGTTYEILLIAALRTCLGQDWGLLDAPGFKQSAQFYTQSIGPSGRHFNFADSSEGQELTSPIVYLARELQQPALLNPKRDMIRRKQGLHERYAPLVALWWPVRENSTLPPLRFIGQGAQPVAIWRSSWSDPDTLWFAIKGGGAHHNHAHMDAGSFVLDWGGVRWARDLGMQDYYSLESQGIDLWNMKQSSPRWMVFRQSSAAHNTLTVDGQLHRVDGMASLQTLDPQTVEIDLTSVLGIPTMRRAHFTGNTVQLDDAIHAAPPGSLIRWAMNTEAAISLHGNHARLQIGDKTLIIHFSGMPVDLSVLDISQPRSTFDQSNPNTRQLVAIAPVDAVGRWQLRVRFVGEK